MTEPELPTTSVSRSSHSAVTPSATVKGPTTGIGVDVTDLTDVWASSGNQGGWPLTAWQGAHTPFVKAST